MSEIRITSLEMDFSAQLDTAISTETAEPTPPANPNIREADWNDPLFVGVLAVGAAMLAGFTWLDNNGRRNKREHLARLAAENQSDTEPTL